MSEQLKEQLIIAQNELKKKLQVLNDVLAGKFEKKDDDLLLGSLRSEYENKISDLQAASKKISQDKEILEDELHVIKDQSRELVLMVKSDLAKIISIINEEE